MKRKIYCGYYFQVEFVGGPFCWNTRIFSATSGKKVLTSFITCFILLSKSSIHQRLEN
jgi:hypothetical protein